MVSFEERLTRMEMAGTITAQQAADMRTSIQSMSRPVLENSKNKLPLGLITVIILAALAVIFLMTGSTPEPETIQDVSEILNETRKVGTMNKNVTTGMSLFIILLPLVLCGIGFVWLYNDLVNKEEDVLSAWAQVEASYQRRADLVPNLVESVKGFVDQEDEIFTQVTQSRQKALESMKGSERMLEDDSALATMAQAQKALGVEITRMFGLVENYPNLRSSDNFLALQDQLEGTENRINVSRQLFNESVRDFNSAIRKMPGALIAGMGNFKRKAYFEADEGTDKATDVDFE